MEPALLLYDNSEADDIGYVSISQIIGSDLD